MACTTAHDFNSNGNYGMRPANGESYGFLNQNGMQTSSTILSLSGHGSDGFSDSDNEETSRLPSQSGQPLHSLTKKKRRGYIEKRRRDRINSSLAELRRLVPAAFEKQGSQKLEKAEILQMTVDHLRHLQEKGLDSLMYDPQRFFSDYRSMGFRECASEVSKCLTVEGIGVQDPLRMRLMSHLQCYSAQMAAAVNTWNAAAAVYAPQQWQYPPPQNNPPPSAASAEQLQNGASGVNYGNSAFAPTAAFKPVANLSQTSTVIAANSAASTGQVRANANFSGTSPNFAASFLTSQSSFQPFSNIESKSQPTTLTAKTWNPNPCPNIA